MPERRGNWDDFARFIRWSQPPSAYVAPSPRQPAASPVQPRRVRDQREAAGLLTPAVSRILIGLARQLFK